MYLGLFVILRFMARRQAGHFGPADLLVIVLIADAAQNGLGKEYQSVTEGLVLVMTIVAWEYLIDWLSYRFPALRPALRPPSLTLVKEGRIVEEAMRKEMLSIDELASQLRQQQVEDIAEVKLATLVFDLVIGAPRARSPSSPPSKPGSTEQNDASLQRPGAPEPLRGPLANQALEGSSLAAGWDA